MSLLHPPNLAQVDLHWFYLTPLSGQIAITTPTALLMDPSGWAELFRAPDSRIVPLDTFIRGQVRPIISRANLAYQKLPRITSPGTEGLSTLLGILMLPALLRTSVKRSADAVAILHATGSTHVNFSRLQKDLAAWVSLVYSIESPAKI
jgi:hypothetical protein